MKWFENSKTGLLLSGFFVGFLVTVVLFPAINYAAETVLPIADAGLPRYAAEDPVILDGTASYDPDNSGPLTYAWQQISGPSVVISDENTATPTISGFIQTHEIRECEFELTISDGELTSLPDTVKVIIVPYFGENLLELKNDSFDPEKPTFIFFGGGDCTNGLPVYARMFFNQATSVWLSKVNAIEFPKGYTPDKGYKPDDESTRTYYQCGDMIIVYLSAVAPNYNQPIQISGHSTGGMPAIDVGIHLNETYGDHRYAVNRVTFFDVACRDDSGQYCSCIERFIASAVDGEQCWVDNYPSAHEMFCTNALNVAFPGAYHGMGREWYDYSLTNEDMNKFDNGVVAGVYWSVIGPGKNLQFTTTLDTETYRFRWYGSENSGRMDFYDEANYPGRLPEPVTLAGPENGAFVDANGALFSCEHSENAVGYQLLFGPDPHRVMDYYIVSDTPNPPGEIVTASPFEPTWWTVRVYDQYGSTIYADPVCVNFETLAPPTIKNLTTGQTYVIIQHAIDDAQNGHEVVVGPGMHIGDINFQGKNLTLRSADPNDSAIVATTIIEGYGRKSVVTFSGGEGAGCVLDGLTITGGIVDVSCGDASPTIRNCKIESIPISIEFQYGYEPTIINCTILGSIMELYGSDCVAYWMLDETDGDTALDSVGNCNGTLSGGPVWQPSDGIVDGALQFDGIDDYVSTEFVLNPADGAFSVFAWIKGSVPGQVIISQMDGNGIGETWLCTDTSNGDLMTGLLPQKIGRHYPQPLISESIISDGLWHHIGLVWDGSCRILYADGIEVTKDTAAQNPLKSGNGGLLIGTSKTLDAGTFFSGLIDDVRIYDGALTSEEIAALAQ